MQKMFKQPCPENSHSTLREPSLRSPNWLVVGEPLMTENVSIRVPKPWASVFPMAHTLCVSLIGELNLVSYCILETSKMLGQSLQCQICIRSSISKPSNIFKWCYCSLYLLVVLFVPSVDLTDLQDSQNSKGLYLYNRTNEDGLARI